MYLSNWLVIAVVVAVLSLYYYKKRYRGTYTKYFKRKWLTKSKLRYYQDNNSPDNRLNSDYYDYLNEKCYSPVFHSTSINKVFSAEEEFVDDLNLCWRLFDFIKDIRYYSLWNEQMVRKDSGVIFTSWYSEEIRHSVKSKKWSESEVAVLFSDKFKLKEDDHVLEYDFNVGSNYYVLTLYPPQFEYNKYYPVMIVRNKIDSPEVFLVVRLYYQTNFGDSYYHYKLEEFRNDDWLQFLLDKMFRVRMEEKKFRVLREQCENEHKVDGKGYWYEEPWENYKNRITGYETNF
jgi:hypothetical protein